MKRLCFALAVLAASALPLGADARRIELADLRRIVSLSEPKMSPDGGRIVYLETRPDYGKDRYESALILLERASGARRTLVSQQPGISSPAWSPRGERVAFIAKGQLWIVSAAGGTPRRITQAPKGVAQFAWRPDGAALAFVASDELSGTKKAALAHHDDGFEVGDNDYLARDIPPPSHLWLIGADGRDERRLTSGAWSVASGEDEEPLSWSPDGRTLLFTRVPSAVIGEGYRSFVEALDLATGATRKLTGHTTYEAAGLFSPDGTRIAYGYSRGGAKIGLTQTYVTTPAGGAGESVSAALDRNVAQTAWLPDGQSLLLQGHDGTRTALWRKPLTGPAQRLNLGAVTIESSLLGAIGPDGALVFVGTTPQRPGELYFLAPGDRQARRLTDANREIAALELGDAKPFEWDGPDGFREDGVLTRPPGFMAGKTYPLVVSIHGGPTDASVTGWYRLGQLMAARGYLVFQPNYRGSDNRGETYQRATVGNANEGAGNDIMAGVAALQATGIVDRARMAVSGWSYGGLMTAWLIGHYQVWKAAVAGAPVTDWMVDYAASDLPESDRLSFGGSPYTGNRATEYARQSPITYAASITTPTLILSNVNDSRVPIVQAYELFRALRDNHVPVSFIAYPTAGHFPSDPVRLADVYRRWLSWLDRYLK